MSSLGRMFIRIYRISANIIFCYLNIRDIIIASLLANYRIYLTK